MCLERIFPKHVKGKHLYLHTCSSEMPGLHQGCMTSVGSLKKWTLSRSNGGTGSIYLDYSVCKMTDMEQRFEL